MSDGCKETFAGPGKDYRGAPFWSWNDRLDPEEIRRQVRTMRAGGMGGFFMHSRIGLESEYLGEEWMAAVAAAVDEAKRVGMNAWLYDEDRWPSGFAGGKVVARDPEFANQALVMEVGAKPHPQAAWFFRGRIRDGKIGDVRRISRQEAESSSGGKVLSFGVRRGVSVGWFGDQPYCDNLNPDSVRAFIEITLEAYRRRFGKQFGKVIPGVFTDEPNVMSWHGLPPGRYRVPWTTRFPDFFRARRGYDILNYLPFLFYRCGETDRYCHDFWRTITELFVQSYTQQIGQWCAHNGLALTGHMLAEQPLFSQIFAGGAAMPHYEHMQAPGIDMLTEQIDETITVKQCTSMANQFGRKRTLSELYGCAGWAFTFEGQKWSGDWQVALGINTRCQHLAPYSLRGARKRDYPPTFFHHQPWWKYHHVVEDYFARACYVTSLGRAVRDLLVIHPVSSGWANMTDRAQVDALGDAFLRLSEDLLGMHYDFDYGDELILARYGRAGRGTIKVNKAGYKLVVLPKMTNLLSSTVALLRGYLDGGGKMVAVRDLPTHVDGQPAPGLAELFSHENVTVVAEQSDEIADALESLLPRQVDVRNLYDRPVKSVIYQLRQHGGRRYCFLINRDRDNGFDLVVSLRGKGGVELWDLETGKTRPLGCRFDDGCTVVELPMPPTGSAVLVLDPKAAPKTSRVQAVKPTKVLALPETWNVRRTTWNSLPLDRCRWRFGRRGAQWSAPMPVWKAQAQLRAKLGLEDVSTSAVAQPWVRRKRLKEVGDAAVELRFGFAVADPPSEPTYLVIESPENFEIAVNGRAVDNTPTGWWIDQSFSTVPIAPAVRVGENEIVLRTRYRDEHELEECYIAGDFAVDRATRAIQKERPTVKSGDWCNQGYPFYAGNLVYEQQVDLRVRRGKRCLLRVGRHFGAAVAVRVNGGDAGVRGWPPYDFQVGRLLKSGSNAIEVEVCGSPRNLLGPNHLNRRWPRATGPESFVDEKNMVEDYNLQPYGLFDPVALHMS